MTDPGILVWQWSSGTPYTYSDWSDHIGIGIAYQAHRGGYYTEGPQHLNDIYSNLQPNPHKNATCTTAFLASPFNPKWLQIPCNVALAPVVICESNFTVHPQQVFRKRSNSECPRAWLKLNSVCLIEQIQIRDWQGTLTTKDSIPCTIDIISFTIEPSDFHLSFLHQWSGNSKPKLILTKTQNFSCLLFPSNMDSNLGGNSSVVGGPCEDLTRQADSFLCYASPFNIEADVCLPGHYRCWSGTCILSEYQCDGITHCKDNSDEKNCTNVCYLLDSKTHSVNCYVNCSRPFCMCSEHYYQCKVGGCVPWTHVCDCMENCADGSDEDFCPDNIYSLPLYRNRSYYENGMFHCSLEQNIPVNLVGDKMPDCLANPVDEELYINISTGLHDKENTQCETTGNIPCQDGLPRCFPREKLCIFERHELGGINYCRNGEHLRNCFDFECPKHLKCPYSFCVPFYATCDGRYDCPDGEDELGCDTPCPGLLRCVLDGLCIHPSNIGDGSVNCKLSGDDEVEYQHFQCPSYCDCRGRSATCAGHMLLQPISWNWPVNSLNYSKTGIRLSPNFIERLPKSLLSLDLSRNDIRNVTPLIGLSNLLYFYINDNQVTSIDREAFKYSTSILLLNLVRNPVVLIASYSFLPLHKLSSLDLNHLHLQELSHFTFAGLDKCLSLNLSNNRLRELQWGMFEGLTNLRVLDIRRNNLVVITSVITKALPRIKVVHLDNIQFCCLFEKATTCYGATVYGDESCDYLIPNTMARYVGWITATLSLILNLGSFVCWRKRGDISVIAVAVCGLNSSDLLMGVSLFLVLFMDFQSRGAFVAQYSATWRETCQCLLASYLSVISYQLSMTFLAIIYFFRLYAIRFPFKVKRNKPYRKIAIITVLSFSLSLGLGTWLLYSYQSGSTVHIKAVNSMCNIAPVIKNTNAFNPGYITILFTNMSLYSVITTCAWLIVHDTNSQLRSMSTGLLPTSPKRILDSRQLIIKIILTWTCTTVSFLGLMVTSAGIFESILGDINQWLAFLALPLNSIVNPALYTFCTPQFLSSLTRTLSGVTGGFGNVF